MRNVLLVGYFVLCMAPAYVWTVSRRVSIPRRAEPSPGSFGGRQATSHFSRSLLLVTGVAIIALANLVVLRLGLGQFVMDGLLKKLLLPPIWSFLVLLFIVRRASVSECGRLGVATRALAVLGIVLGVLGALLGNSVAPLAQDVLLFTLPHLALSAGVATALRWGAIPLARAVAMSVGAASVVLAVGFASPLRPIYAAPVIAASAALIARSTIEWKHLVRWLGAATIVLLWSSPVLRSGDVALLTVFLGGMSGWALTSSRRSFVRRGAASLMPLMAVMLCGAIIALPLLLRSQQDSDLTIAGRLYEQRAVTEDLSSLGGLNLLFGHGLGGTVDLTNSPDRATLLGAGRTLEAVDDAHLLAGHLLLKGGLIGLAWLLLLLFQIGKLLQDALKSSGGSANSRHSRYIAGVLILAATAEAVSASTHLFANPGLWFVAGIGLAKGRLSAGESQPVHTGR